MMCKSWLAAGMFFLGLFCPGPARSMTVDDFVRMNNDDEATFVAALVDGAAKMLKAQGKPDQAQEVVSFFKDPGKNGGVNQLAINLKTINTQNTRNQTNPNNRAPVYEVEDAMEMTLRDHGITVPVGYLFSINKNFRPSGLPRSLTGK